MNRIPPTGRIRLARAKWDGFVPSPADFPVLPEAWHEALLRPEPAIGPRRRGAGGGGSSRRWVMRWGAGPMCQQTATSLAYWLEQIPFCAYEAAKGGSHALIGDLAAGHLGATSALCVLRRAYVAEASSRGRQRAQRVAGEWKRMCVGAVEKLARGRPGPDPCAALVDGLAPRSLSPARVARLKAQARERHLRVNGDGRKR